MSFPSDRLVRTGALAALAVVIGISSAPAADLGWSMKDSVMEDPQYGFRIDGGVSVGNLNGTAHETVYVPNGEKLSELIWTAEDIIMLGGKLEMSGSPWWRVGVEGWTNASDDATMDDFDWINPLDGNDPTSDWTHWSHHKSTALENVQLIDAYGVLTLFRLPSLSLSAVAGYRWDKYRWVAKGGSFVYSDDPTGAGPWDFRGYEGTFSENSTVITYQQDFSAPYLGLAATANLGPLTVEGRVVASSWVQAEGVDDHWLRGLRFRDDFDSGEMVEVDVNGNYQISPEIALTAAYKYLEYQHMKGQTRIGGAGSGSSAFVGSEDGAGIDNESQLVSLGVVYSFN